MDEVLERILTAADAYLPEEESALVRKLKGLNGGDYDDKQVIEIAGVALQILRRRRGDRERRRNSKLPL